MRGSGLLVAAAESGESIMPVGRLASPERERREKIRMISEYAMARQAVNGRNMLPIHTTSARPSLSYRIIRFIVGLLGRD
jgi:hypothetical protein